MTPQQALAEGVPILPSLLVPRGTAVVYRLLTVTDRTAGFVHPIDLITLRHPDDLIAQLQHTVRFLLVDEVERRLHARARFREATR